MVLGAGIEITEKVLKKYDYVYETARGIMHVLLVDDEFTRSFENVKQRLLEKAGAIAVYGMRVTSSEQLSVIIDGMEVCSETSTIYILWRQRSNYR